MQKEKGLANKDDLVKRLGGPLPPVGLQTARLQQETFNANIRHRRKQNQFKFLRKSNRNNGAKLQNDVHSRNTRSVSVVNNDAQRKAKEFLVEENILYDHDHREDRQLDRILAVIKDVEDKFQLNGFSIPDNILNTTGNIAEPTLIKNVTEKIASLSAEDKFDANSTLRSVETTTEPSPADQTNYTVPVLKSLSPSMHNASNPWNVSSFTYLNTKPSLRVYIAPKIRRRIEYSEEHVRHRTVEHVPHRTAEHLQQQVSHQTVEHVTYRTVKSDRKLTPETDQKRQDQRHLPTVRSEASKDGGDEILGNRITTTYEVNLREGLGSRERRERVEIFIRDTFIPREVREFN